MSATILAIANQKGGVGKTTTTANLGIGLARTGKRVLLIDADPQASLTISLGYANPDNFPVTLTQLLQVTAQIGTPRPGEGILHHAEGVDLLPSSIELCSMEMTLINVLSRETTMKRLLEPMKKQYDYILIDCPPSLGLLTVNALVAADKLLIPIQCEFYALEGVTKLLESMKRVKSRLNPTLDIYGILLTMYDSRTTLSKQVVDEVREYFGRLVFATPIPRTVKLSEAPSFGQPITQYDPKGRGALSYIELAKEVIARG